MQPTLKKLQTPPKLQPDSNHALYQNLKDRLHQILHSLLQQKQVWQNRQNKRSQLIRKQLTSRQHAFSQLAAQNAQLKSQLQMARRHLQRVLPDLQAMGRENEVLQRSSIRTQNIITYLQTKNKQLNYGLIQAKRAIVRLKENKSKAYNSHLPEYNFDKIDYRSIFDYTGVLEEISIEELRKSKSSPKFQAITTASSCQPKPVKTQRSDTQSRQTSIKQELLKQMQTFDEKAQGKQEKAIKGSLKKIGTLGYLSHAEHKRNLKQMKSAKRFSMDRETQIGQKQRVETKSRVPNKGENGQNAENGRKAQNGRKRK